MNEATMASPPSSNDTSGFLSLPSELRNRIYDESLIQQTDIPLSRRTWNHQPPLLLTCRQIRRETTKLFYARNTFTLLVENYTSSICVRFFQLQKRYNFRNNVGLIYAGKPDWENLLVWLHLVNSKACIAPIGFGSGRFRSIKETVLENMFALVRDARELRYAQSWEQIVQLLEIQRSVLVAMDCRWGRERGQLNMLRNSPVKRIRRLT